jgi:hypothetical protein
MGRVRIRIRKTNPSVSVLFVSSVVKHLRSALLSNCLVLYGAPVVISTELPVKEPEVALSVILPAVVVD